MCYIQETRENGLKVHEYLSICLSFINTKYLFIISWLSKLANAEGIAVSVSSHCDVFP